MTVESNNTFCKKKKKKLDVSFFISFFYQFIFTLLKQWSKQTGNSKMDPSAHSYFEKPTLD